MSVHPGITLFLFFLCDIFFEKNREVACFTGDYSTGASDRSFYPILNKRFDHLETLLTICRLRKVLSAGSLYWPLVPSPQSKCHTRTCMLPQKYHISVSIVLSKPLKCFMEDENINFRGQTWVRPPAKCWVKGFILPHKYHAPNFYQRFLHTLAN